MGLVVIAGASGTIGSSIAKRLVSVGKDVLLLGRSADKLAPLAGELSQPYAVVDYHDAEILEQTIRDLVKPDAVIEGIVNAIGSILVKPLQSTSLEEFQDVLETNLITAFQMLKVGARLLSKTGGSVVLFASAAAEIGMPNHEAIAASKAGVIGLARSAAATLASRDIRVNVVSPGLVQTELTRKIWEVPASLAAAREMHALGRIGEPTQIASLVEWLLDVENNWITGQVIGLDGGLSCVLPRRRQ
jgi:NAD(P)-dependent dehydrogenase (short-subunit alcohol dehydrogenase family)